MMLLKQYPPQIFSYFIHMYMTFHDFPNHAPNGPNGLGNVLLTCINSMDTTTVTHIFLNKEF